jgi:hypothetical protein
MIALIGINFSPLGYIKALSHIPQFGDAVSPIEDLDFSARHAHLQNSEYVTLLNNE